MLSECDVQEIYEALKDNFRSDKSKMNYVINIYCGHYVDSNLWTLQKMHEYMKNPKNIVQVLHLLKKLTRKSFDVSSIPSRTDVNAVLERHNNIDICDETVSVCKKMQSGAATALTVLIDLLKTNSDVKAAVLLTKYIVSLKPKELFIDASGGKDIVWILFGEIYDIVKDTPLVGDYVGYAKDIYFFNAKKDRMKRFPLLLNAVYVASKNRVRHRQVEMPMSCLSIEDRMSYLYTLFDQDEEVCEGVETDKRRKSRGKPVMKALSIDSKDYERLERLRNDISIIKSQ